MVLGSLSPQRRRLFRIIGVVVFVVVVVAALSGIRAIQRDDVRPVSQTDPGPVLLVPGYGGSTGALEELADSLSRAGKQTIVVSAVGDGTGDLREQAEHLDEVAGDVLARTGASSVDVVGYSAGGVIARLWAAELGGGSLARRIVTLGSPHHGTDVAGFAALLAPSECPIACQQLITGSELLNGLNAGDESPAGPVWVSLWSTTDELVVPPSASSLDGAINVPVQSVCGNTDIAHGDLPRDTAIAHLTATALRDTTLTGLTSADC